MCRHSSGPLELGGKENWRSWALEAMGQLHLWSTYYRTSILQSASSSSQSHKSTNKGGPWSGSNCQVIILSWGSWCGGQRWPSSQRYEFWCWLAILPGCAACVRLLVSLGLNFLVSKMGDITSLGGSNELAMWLCCVTCWAQVRRWL